VNAAVELSGVRKSFGAIKAVDNVSLSVQPGEVVAVLGPNGAGKTTAISLMLGLRRPDAGTVRVFGRDPTDPVARDRVGVMLQESDVPGSLRVREVVDLIGRHYPNPLTARQALEMADLTHKADSLASSLSGGQKKRLCFALSLVGNPDVLFLDEPTAALDVEARRGFWTQVSQFAASGKTILLTTHYLEEADALAERIVVMGGGQIVAQGSPAQIKSRVGGKIVRFKAPNVQTQTLAALPDVTRASLNGDTFELYTLQPERVLRDLFTRDLEITDLEIKGSGLEEAFVELTSSRNARA
jgi:ABC-2 type transport system ATP-binding protein